MELSFPPLINLCLFQQPRCNQTLKSSTPIHPPPIPRVPACRPHILRDFPPPQTGFPVCLSSKKEETPRSTKTGVQSPKTLRFPLLLMSTALLFSRVITSSFSYCVAALPLLFSWAFRANKTFFLFPPPPHRSVLFPNLRKYNLFFTTNTSRMSSNPLPKALLLVFQVSPCPPPKIN